MNDPPLTAALAGLLNCHSCGKLSHSRDVPPNGLLLCPRCGTHLSQRKPNSISRTWALVLAAMILYIPANLYPIMTVRFMGKGEPDTILSGVMHLFSSGSWAVATLVFFASIIVPMLKLIGLSCLLLSIQFRWKWRPRDRTALYRVIEAVGRWSMLDIFVIAVLVSLVKVGNVATILPGIGATSFAAVVVITMFAAESFDPRLLWDSRGEDR